MSSWEKNKMAGRDFIFLFIIRVVFFYDPSWSESNFILFLFFHSIRVGPSRSELIQPGLVVRVDPVQLLYLPVFVPLETTCAVIKIARGTTNNH